MSSFEMFSQMFNDKWQWIVASLITLAIVAIAAFFLKMDNDLEDPDVDDDESVDLEIVMKMMGPGELSVKRQVDTIELIREREANQFELNNYPSGSDRSYEMTGMEIAENSSEQENTKSFEVKWCSVETVARRLELLNILIRWEKLKKEMHNPTNYSVGNKATNQVPNKKKSFSTLKGLCCCCWTKKSKSKTTNMIVDATQ